MGAGSKRGHEPEPPGDGRSPLARTVSGLGPYLQIGWIFVFAQLIGTGIGWWLDGKLGTRPWLLVAGALLGMAAGFVNLFRVTRSLGKGGGR